MHYTDRPNSVRVDFFKETGKWYATESVEWSDDLYADKLPNGDYMHIRDRFRKVLGVHLKGRMVGMIAVCLEPYSEHGYPVMHQIRGL